MLCSPGKSPIAFLVDKSLQGHWEHPSSAPSWPYQPPMHSPRVSIAEGFSAARLEQDSEQPNPQPPAHTRAIVATGLDTRALTGSLGPKAMSKSAQEGRAGQDTLQRQNEAGMTNESSQRCRSFPAQSPHRFLCEMVTLCTFIGVVLHTYCSLNLHNPTASWPY